LKSTAEINGEEEPRTLFVALSTHGGPEQPDRRDQKLKCFGCAGCFGSVYWGKDSRTLWSSGFFLCSVGGATLEILKQYIENRAANRVLDHLPTVNGGIA
jgi:hypothetical protein